MADETGENMNDDQVVTEADVLQTIRTLVTFDREITE